jgi:glycosyltransferase involved in cell wall biosynthesis
MSQNKNFQNVSLCLMVWNEKAGCESDIPLLQCERFLEVYAVDGSSTDGTVEFIESQGIHVYKQPVKSLNAAYHYAVELCKGDKLIVYFPKGSIDPKCIIDIADNLKRGNELVIASRNIQEAKNEEDDQLFRPRKWGVKLLAIIAAILWRREGYWIRDILHGVKGFSVSAFRQMEISPTGLTVDLEMAVRSYQLNIKRMEVPVAEKSRVTGESHFPIIPTSKYLAAFLLKEIIRSFFSYQPNSQKDRETLHTITND